MVAEPAVDPVGPCAAHTPLKPYTGRPGIHEFSLRQRNSFLFCLVGDCLVCLFILFVLLHNRLCIVEYSLDLGF